MIDLHPPAQRIVGLVTSVTDDQLGRPTPCGVMRVGDLIDHLGLFAVRFVASARKNTGDRTSPPLPPDAQNLEAGWRDRVSQDLVALADAWRDPKAWEGTTYAGSRDRRRDELRDLVRCAA